jgi:hypothetical protein
LVQGWVHDQEALVRILVRTPFAVFFAGKFRHMEERNSPEIPGVRKSQGPEKTDSFEKPGTYVENTRRIGL